MSAQPQLTLPAGALLPSDAERARELIELELERQAEEARAREFIEALERQRLFCPSI